MKTLMNLKSKKMMLVIIAAVSSLAAFSQPQEEPRPPMLPDSAQIVRRVNHLALDLSLTDQQKESILKLHFAHFKELKLQKEKHDALREKMREEMETLKQKFDEEIESKLTDEQKEKFAIIKETREQKPPKGDQKPRR